MGTVPKNMKICLATCIITITLLMSMACGKHFIIKTWDNQPMMDYTAPMYMDYTRMVPDYTTDPAPKFGPVMDYGLLTRDLPATKLGSGSDYDKDDKPTTIDPLYTRIGKN